MINKIYFQLMLADWVVVRFLVSVCIDTVVFNLSFCESNTISTLATSCPWSALLVTVLSCETATFVLSDFVLVGSFILIMISYVFIGFIVMKMPSAKGRYKAFSTCFSLWCAYTVDLLALSI